jgi:preprotein translocase subunit SecA
LNCAIHAEFLLKRDVDYIVRNGTIELVDEFTGRVADKRRWPDGLQAALEAKEKLSVRSRGNILNSITLQHFLRQYPKICGMTATAVPAETELRSFYGLTIVVIPPNKPCIRRDEPDVIFRTRAEKNNALVGEILKVNKTQRPILVGTRSVEESESLYEALLKKGVACNVLNAKRDAYEAQIVAEAGRPGAVTISTNMAGRGTDIRLGGVDEKDKERVVALGGLYVIGTNKHESHRIDMQLRGRAGRQGDPGSSRFLISLEDELFVKYRLEELLPADFLGRDEGVLDHPLLKREIDRIQRIIEGQNTSIKQTLNKYGSILEQHRRIVFSRRYGVLNEGEAPKFFKSRLERQFKKIQESMDGEAFDNLCMTILLSCIDHHWSQYLAEVADIREGIHLHSLGGKTPFYEFQKIVVELFPLLNEQIDKEALRIFNDIRISGEEIHIEEGKLKAPTATWTYLVSDNPFENMIGAQLMGNMGLSIGAGIYGPLVALFSMIRKKKRKQSQRIY